MTERIAHTASAAAVHKSRAASFAITGRRASMPGKQRRSWSMKGVARWAMGRRKSRRTDCTRGSECEDEDDGRLARSASVVGMTEKERERVVASLEHTEEESRGGNCAKCDARRRRLDEIRAEFERLRTHIISDDVVEMTTPYGETEPELVELAQESARLRITIDSLMRFQVRKFTRPSFFLRHIDIPLCFPCAAVVRVGVLLSARFVQ